MSPIPPFRAGDLETGCLFVPIVIFRAMFTSGPSFPSPSAGAASALAWPSPSLIFQVQPFLSLSLSPLSFPGAHSLKPARGRVAPGQTYASFHSTNPPLAWRNNCSSGHGFWALLSLAGSHPLGTRHFNQILSLILSAFIKSQPRQMRREHWRGIGGGGAERDTEKKREGKTTHPHRGEIQGHPANMSWGPQQGEEGDLWQLQSQTKWISISLSIKSTKKPSPSQEHKVISPSEEGHKHTASFIPLTARSITQLHRSPLIWSH